MSTYHNNVGIPSLMSTHQRYSSLWYHLILLILILQWLCRHTITYLNIPKTNIFMISFNIVNWNTWISLLTYQLRNIISYNHTMSMIIITELTILKVQLQWQCRHTIIHCQNIMSMSTYQWKRYVIESY